MGSSLVDCSCYGHFSAGYGADDIGRYRCFNHVCPCGRASHVSDAADSAKASQNDGQENWDCELNAARGKCFICASKEHALLRSQSLIACLINLDKDQGYQTEWLRSEL